MSSASDHFRPDPTPQEYDNHTALYRVAYGESIRALEDQVDELSGMRQRVVQFLAFVGSATAFLLGSSLNVLTQSPRDALFYVFLLVGCLAALVSIGAAVTMLAPRFTQLGVTSSAQRIIARHIERDVPAANEGQLLRNLALYNDQTVVLNDATLSKTRWLYTSSVGLGALQLLVWIVLIWARA